VSTDNSKQTQAQGNATQGDGSVDTHNTTQGDGSSVILFL